VNASVLSSIVGDAKVQPQTSKPKARTQRPKTKDQRPKFFFWQPVLDTICKPLATFWLRFGQPIVSLIESFKRVLTR